MKLKLNKKNYYNGGQTCMGRTISELALEYFMNHPNQPLVHGIVVDWVTEQWLKEHDTPPRDVWRAIRRLHQLGKLKKVKKGIYMYDPGYVHDVVLWNFSSEDKKTILERDNYQCVVCGRGIKDGVEIVVDHRTPKDKGGTNNIDNGQVLCSKHNLMKKNYSQTESGKRYFIKIYQQAVKLNDTKMIAFCQSVFDAYDEHDIDRHIARPDF